MPTPNSDTIRQRNLIAVLSGYRLLIALLLLLLFNITLDTRLVGDLKPNLFLVTLLAYSVANIALLGLSLNRRLDRSRLLLFTAAIVDIVALNLLIEASGSHSRPLSLFFILAIVGSAMILPTRLSLLVAALATISVLGQAISRVLSHNLPASEFATAGTLGLVFFITAFAVQQLVFRATRNEILARQRAADLEDLQLLNEKIVQRMRTGIVVIDDSGSIFLINESARNLLGMSTNIDTITGQGIPTVLVNAWKAWTHNPKQLPSPFQVQAAGPAVQASFTALSAGESGQSLVFLEDTRMVKQQAQALKLGSLGRLTASIAHEIRNPLGAISHAAQLLSESNQLCDADRRFSEIINTQSTRVNQVVENVLALSRRDNPKPRQFDLNGYLARFIQQYRSHSADELHITFRSSGQTIEVTFDLSQLDQVLSNLFDNGLRYSAKATGRSTLNVRAYFDPSNDLPQLDVIDQGPGIDKDKLSKLFEPFYTTENSGSGLGLYLAREICEAHQAELSHVRTEHNQSCFRISFPHPRKRWLA
jgi:two-component system sensor histidine kinase PilS (NtrC family)